MREVHANQIVDIETKENIVFKAKYPKKNLEMSYEDNGFNFKTSCFNYDNKVIIPIKKDDVLYKLLLDLLNGSEEITLNDDMTVTKNVDKRLILKKDNENILLIFTYNRDNSITDNRFKININPAYHSTYNEELLERLREFFIKISKLFDYHQITIEEYSKKLKRR